MVSKITAASVLRTFASKHLVVVQRDTLTILGSSGNMAHARATGAAKAGENGYRVVDLSDVEGFAQAAKAAGDNAAVKVAARKSRAARRQVAEWILEGAIG